MTLPILIADSPNFDARPNDAIVDMIIIHYTGMPTAEAALQRLCDDKEDAKKRGRVSAHYLITEEGIIHSLVDEKDRAWHAGISHWRGRNNLNDFSIGIEMVNPGHEFGYRPFPRAQMDALIELCKGICGRHPIQQDFVLGHSDVAPSRKLDPGEKFNWRLLSKAGIGVWPETIPEDYARSQSFMSSPTGIRNALIKFGYSPDVDASLATQAFNRHFSGNDSNTLSRDAAAALVSLNRKILKSA